MGAPAYRGFDVAIDALHTEADYWDDRSREVNDIATIAETLTMRFEDWHHFTTLNAKYEELREMIISRCRAGAKEMGGADGISAALRWVAEQYEVTERKIEARMLGLAPPD